MRKRLALFIALVVFVAVVPGAGIAAPRDRRVGAPSAGVATGTPINLNTADVKALMGLTGIGRKVAEKIVEYRETHGPFKKVEDLRKVDGIGSGLWEKNRERIVVK